MGGPIVKDKTFFFLDYEGQREGVGVVSLDCVPTAAHIAAAEAQHRRRGRRSQPDWSGAGELLSPRSERLYSGRLHRTTRGAFDASGSFAPDYVASAPSLNNLSSVIAKIDHSFNANNNVSGRYFFGDSTQQFPLATDGFGRPVARL